MSNITINLCLSEDSEPRKTISLKRKNKRLRRNRRIMERKGQAPHGRRTTLDQTPRHNGACSDRPPHATSTQCKRPPHPGSVLHRTSSEPPASNHSLPSWTVNSKGSHQRPKEPVNTTTSSASSSTAAAGPSVPSSYKSAANPTKYLALDCEMVGAGPKGHICQLARCSIVSYDGDVVYDKFINPSMPVTDYRTRWSGIRRSDLVKATPYTEARKEILRLLMGKVVIGHAVHNDFKVLGYAHPAALTRDTSRIPLLNLKAGFAENECASLKRLTKAIFNRDIQVGRKGHSSVEDARATMELYKEVEEEWERRLASSSQGR